MDDPSFEPWLGRMRSRHSHADRRFFHAVIAVAARHDRGIARVDTPRRVRFRGVRLGRGNAAAAALRMKDRDPAFRARSARIEIIIKRLQGNGFQAAVSHLRYIVRDGVTPTGDRGFVYSATEDRANGRDFLERCRDDRHQFRITASAKEGYEYADLKPLIRLFMARVEDDLDTRLDWIAADHADTRHPHTHILLRGRDDVGDDLVIAPNYFYYGMRERLAGIVSLDLGPPIEAERIRRLHLEVEAEQVTSLDRNLLRSIDESGAVAVSSPDMVEHSILTGRLQKLGALGLASPLAGGRWRVAPDFVERLDALGKRAMMTGTLRRQLASSEIERACAEQVIHDTGSDVDLWGKVLGHGRVRGPGGTHFIIVDATDGRSHYVEAQHGLAGSWLHHPIVHVTTRRSGAPASAGAVEVELLSHTSLDELTSHDGATFLDHELIAPRIRPRDAGFGHELRSAMAVRRAWLVEQGLAAISDGRTTYRADMLPTLERRDMIRVAAELMQATGRTFTALEEGKCWEGTVQRPADLGRKQFALIDNGHEFTLVPWQPAFEEAIGKNVRITASAGAFSWTIGRGRELEI